MIRFGAEICRDLNQALRREWLETNGLGGFASSTIVGLNTRRYHALLCAALDPPSSRHVLLPKFEETLVLNGQRYELSSNQYPGAVHPTGFTLQSSFRLDPFPVFTWLVEDVELHKTVFLVHGENTVCVRYLLRAQGQAARHECSLELRPLIAFRDFHSTTHANDAINSNVELAPGRATVAPYSSLPALHFAHDAESVTPAGVWYFNFEYAHEHARGLDHREDLFNPFVLQYDLSRRIQASVIASLEQYEAADLAGLRIDEANRRKTLRSFAADQFVVNRAQGKTMIAGYHWFGDWGRDTMIALPGLTLLNGMPAVAREILLEFSHYVSEGMLPNRFPDRGQTPEYNTVDAAFRYFEATRAYLAATGDREFVMSELLPVLEDIVAHHRAGTRYGIRVAPDGLLETGELFTQLTWMDATIGGVPVTPRTGKPVEIQALWYNALCFLHQLAPEGPYGEMAARAKASFALQFWNESANCLYDVISSAGADESIRPNQLAAISLHYKIFDDRERTLRILNVVERELLTPYGLRTLSPGHPHYRGRYQGDATYHQGTVWPWLMGIFAEAYLNAHNGSAEAKGRVREWLAPLTAYMHDPGLNHICEIFDGDAPHEPRGAIAQAWSLGEVLRALSLAQE